MKRVLTALLVVTLSLSLSAADTDFPIYFEDSTLALKSQTIDRTTYLPLVDIVRHLGLAYTDATGVVTFSIQGRDSRVVLTPGSTFVSVNDQPTLLQSPIRRENGQWLVPLDFLSQGLSRVADLEFRYRPGTRRVFAGKVLPAELAMNAQTQGSSTRLTLRAGLPVDVELQRDMAQHRAALILKGRPIDPARERLDFKDALVQSVAFEDSAVSPRVIVNFTEEVRDIRLTPAEGNLVYTVDFVRETITETAPAPAAPPAVAPPVPVPAAKPAAPALSSGGVRVIVIDAGHGGIDSGTINAGTLEKDLTLSLARHLRTALQGRLGATVILTRDSDVALTSEERAAVANNNQAGVFISLHTGYSPDKSASGSSIYLMKPDFTGGLPEPRGGRLFYPWYMAYRLNQPASTAIAASVQRHLNEAFPGWKFPIRFGPIAVLASATVPAVAVEVGNLNNDVSVKTLIDPESQIKLASAIAAGIERFVSTQAGGRQP
jgi:N-acetylmuramoyl-L-alanine amidase